MSNLTVAWESVGFRGSGRPARRWVAAIPPPALKTDSFPSQSTLLGILGMSDAVPVDLEYLDLRYGWILESRIDREGGVEVAPLLV